jgi:hypothetical protein
MARARSPQQVSLDPQMLRFSQAGQCCPPRLDRTNRALPHGSSLAANRDPNGFLDKGDVMIHRPCLTAWSVANPTPASVVHLLNRSRIR